MRTFIAIPLPPESHALLDEMQQRLRYAEADIRWTSVASIHLTLRFLGDVEPSKIPLMKELLSEKSGGETPFSLRLYGLGGFPNLGRPRVIWCGIEGDIQRLRSLQKKVENACRALNFLPEERPFHPHLTLGRVKSRRNLHRLSDCIKMVIDLESVFVVNQFNIYRSSLTPRGAIYTVMESIRLPE